MSRFLAVTQGQVLAIIHGQVLAIIHGQVLAQVVTVVEASDQAQIFSTQTRLCRVYVLKI